MSNFALLEEIVTIDETSPWKTSKDPSLQDEARSYTEEKTTEIAKWTGYPRPVLPRLASDAIRARYKTAEREYRAVEKAIIRSRYIFTLEDDWDEEGAPRFDKRVWEKATAYALRVAEWANISKHSTIGTLSISPAHSGSIDLYWENPFSDLLLNIPQTGTLGTFYGKNLRGEIFSGAAELMNSCPELIVEWLRKKTS
jgi:hypothetical protein